ncbi:glycosyltransferase family 2 protein [Rhizobium sp. AC44/96]|uniref:glycosyltransferase n=1 Tax=Rhizobium sp. AC44/96 TaxID=1841654 RepID=UPI0009F17B1D|nr:glycosyltransferase family A protein [Rhizobium sp. AC44/96]
MSTSRDRTLSGGAQPSENGYDTTALELVAEREGSPNTDVGIVVIGRNEGQRLIDCLLSVKAQTARVVYVDSGSKDGSLEHATSLGVVSVALDNSLPFTAARGRNTGFATLTARWPDVRFVQFIDGDCQLHEGWLERARSFLVENEKVAAVFGDRRERFPDRTVFNALCDRDWSGWPGEVDGCGGDVMMRVSAFREAEGYSDAVIAGEEPEFCVRLREKGWSIWRIAGDMSRHDANMLSFRQWWRRALRGGYAFAEVSFIHRNSPFTIWKHDVTRTVFWAAILPLIIVVFDSPSMLALYPLQILRLALRDGFWKAESWRNALFDGLAKFPEMQGIAKFYLNMLIGRLQTIIEYK